MRKFVITVNGASYEVEVEEVSGTVQSAVPAPSPVVAPAPVAVAASAPSPAPVAAAVPVSGDTINAPMPGAVLDVKVKAGDAVKKGTVLLILEAMKMENEIVAPRDAKIAQVIVSKGTTVNSGDPMLVLN